MADITAFDYILLPFYLFFIYKIAFYYRDKYYPDGHVLRPYFINGLSVKIAGAIFIGLIYGYYYGGGDTFSYFFHAKLINSTLFESPGTWFRLMTHTAQENNFTDEKALSELYWYNEIPTYTTAIIGAVIGLFCFTKYLVINVIVASISFIGVWLLFVTFAIQYNNIIKYIAIAVLFIPGPIVWGSGLFKDSFCVFAVGCLIYSLYFLLEKRTVKTSLLFLTVLSIILLVLIKAYILVALLPILVFKVVMVYGKKLNLHPDKRTLFYSVLIIITLISVIVVRNVAIYLSSFTAENVLQTVVVQKNYLLSVSLKEDGAAYDLGDFEPTLVGISKMILPAVNVTLFRPYVWETRSVIQLFDALQSAGVLVLTIYLLIKKNIFSTIRRIFTDPNLIMCLMFTLIFAFFVGVSSYNFGSLSRYKIPCTPFYLVFLMVLLFGDKHPKAQDSFIE